MLCDEFETSATKKLLLGSTTLIGLSFPQCDLSERICELLYHLSFILRTVKFIRK